MARTNVYQVNAYIKDSKAESGLRSIWQFNAIEAKSQIGAIKKCRELMMNILGNCSTRNKSYSKLKWKAKLEWEDNLAVN